MLWFDNGLNDLQTLSGMDFYDEKACKIRQNRAYFSFFFIHLNTIGENLFV